MKTLRLATQVLSLTMLTAVTSQAYALSCMRPDPVQSCKSMQAEKLNPIVANGTLKLSKLVSQEEVPGAIGGKGPAVADYLFTGNVSDKSGKRYVMNEPIRITTSCAASWCARLPQENASGYFLLKSGDDSALSLHIGACTFQPFTVTDEQAKALEACATPDPVIPKIRPKGVKKSS